MVSELFTGSISDRQLTIQSGSLEMLKDVPPGKSIMADEGLHSGLIGEIWFGFEHSSFQGSCSITPIDT